jgi:hypothetical protein
MCTITALFTMEWRGYGTGDVDDPQRAMNDIPEVVEGILNKLSITPQGSASQTPVQ